VQRDVAKARRAARSEYLQMMAAADEARDAGRVEEASRLYSRAQQMFPDDYAATRGKQSVDGATQDLQAGLNAYYRFMGLGMLSMQNGLYLDAARAFGEASRLIPTDIAAARGYRDAVVASNGVILAQAQFYQQLQNGYTALQGRRPADAVTAFQAALRLVPDSPLATAGLQQARAILKK
jgi:tetratricopeptide (TPR) repeat protein